MGSLQQVEGQGVASLVDLPGYGGISCWQAGAARGVEATQWVVLGLHNNDPDKAGASNLPLYQQDLWRSAIAAALRMGYRVMCPDFNSNPAVSATWNNEKTTKAAQAMLLSLLGQLGARVLVMGDGHGGKIALKLVGEMPGLAGILVGVLVYRMPPMQKDSFAKLPNGIPLLIHSAVDDDLSPSGQARAARRKAKDRYGGANIDKVKKKLPKMVLLENAKAFAATAASLIPDTPFAGAAEEVSSWLKLIGCGHYEAIFRAAAITPQLCETLGSEKWTALFDTELLPVTAQDRLTIVRSIPALLNKDLAAQLVREGAAGSAGLTFGGSPPPTALDGGIAAATGQMISPQSQSVPAQWAGFGSSAAPATKNVVPGSVSPVEMGGRDSDGAPPPRELPVVLEPDPSTGRLGQTQLGTAWVPPRLGTFGDTRALVEAQLPGLLNGAAWVFVRSGAPVGAKQEHLWVVRAFNVYVNLSHAWFLNYG